MPGPTGPAYVCVHFGNEISGLGVRRPRCRRLRREARTEFLIDDRANFFHRLLFVEQRHGPAPYVETDGAAETVCIPFSDTAIGRTSLHEAVVVPVVPGALAPAVAGYILEHFRMSSGELVNLQRDRHRADGREADRRQWWKGTRWRGLEWNDLDSPSCRGTMVVLSLSSIGRSGDDARKKQEERGSSDEFEWHARDRIPSPRAPTEDEKGRPPKALPAPLAFPLATACRARRLSCR
jgi:hypothetical protein